ncbi:hypothetical protein B0J14DRAFT_231903 [Halenospora varia]|nr:hypothetical protein B0J14DRAFT_231903 [Halenospora varia]
MFMMRCFILGSFFLKELTSSSTWNSRENVVLASPICSHIPELGLRITCNHQHLPTPDSQLPTPAVADEIAFCTCMTSNSDENITRSPNSLCDSKLCPFMHRPIHET